MVNKASQANYSFRPAVDADYEFLYKLHAASMRAYVEKLWGWEESWQQEYFSRKFDPLKRKIIQIEGQDAGVLVVEHRDQQLYLSLIELLPEYQGRGVGTAIITDLIYQARQSNQFVTLHVLKSNKAARRLYERLGFVIAGEDEYRIMMVNHQTEQSGSIK